MSPTSTTIACPVLESLLTHGGVARHPDYEAMLRAAEAAPEGRTDARRLALVDALVREWMPEMWDTTGRSAAAERLRQLPTIMSTEQLRWRGEVHDRVSREANVARSRAGRNGAAPSVDQHRASRAALMLLLRIAEPDRYPEPELGPGPDVQSAAISRAWLATMWPIYTESRHQRYEPCPTWMLEPSTIVDEETGATRSTITPAIAAEKALRTVKRSHELTERRLAVHARARVFVGDLMTRLAAT